MYTEVRIRGSVLSKDVFKISGDHVAPDHPMSIHLELKQEQGLGLIKSGPVPT